MTPPEEPTSRHLVPELGLALAVAGDGLRGRAPVVPELLVPGTGCLRTSVLAIWADVIAGLLVGVAIAPRVPVTLDLAVDLYRPPRGLAAVEAVGRTVKIGRSVMVAAVDFADGERPVATSSLAFMPAPDASFTMPPLADVVEQHAPGGRLRQPLADRARCRRLAPGRAELPRTEDGLNATGTMNGGLIALLAEEAVLSAEEEGASLASLAIRFLLPARRGPAMAEATVRAGLGRVEVRDAGHEDRLTTSATTRSFAADRR